MTALRSICRAAVAPGDRPAAQDVRCVMLPHGECRTARVQAAAFRGRVAQRERVRRLARAVHPGTAPETRRPRSPPDQDGVSSGYLLDATVSALATQSLSARSAATERPRQDATGLDMLPRALRAIPVDKLRMWGVAAASLACVALGIIYLPGPSVLVASSWHFSLAKSVPAGPHPPSHLQGLRRLSGDGRAPRRGFHDGLAAA